MNRRSFFRGILAAPLVPIAAPQWWGAETPLPRMAIDARGASAAAIASLEMRLHKLDASINQRAVMVVADARRRGLA